MERLVQCITQSWRPAIGDPSIFAWLAVGVYLAAALLAFMVALRQPFPAESRRRETAFWLLLSFVLLALAINKQLDLQSLLTAAGRCAAKSQGWYENRRLVQRDLILAMSLVLSITLLFSFYLLHGTLRRTLIPLTGLMFVAGFVLIRAIGFHHMDVPINYEFIAMSANWLLELFGPALVSASAVWLLVFR